MGKLRVHADGAVSCGAPKTHPAAGHIISATPPPPARTRCVARAGKLRVARLSVSIGVALLGGCSAEPAAATLSVAAIGAHDVAAGTTWTWPLHALGEDAERASWSLVRGPTGLVLLENPPRLLWTPSAFDLAPVPVGADRAPGPDRQVVVRAIVDDRLAMGAGTVRAVPHPLAGEIDAPDRIDVDLRVSRGARFSVRTSDGVLAGAPIRLRHRASLASELVETSVGRWDVRVRPLSGGLEQETTRVLIEALDGDSVAAARTVQIVWLERDAAPACALGSPQIVAPLSPTLSVGTLDLAAAQIARAIADPEAGHPPIADIELGWQPAGTTLSPWQPLADIDLTTTTPGLYALHVRTRDADDDAFGGACAATGRWPRQGAALVGVGDATGGPGGCVDDGPIGEAPWPAAGEVTRRLCPGEPDVWTIEVGAQGELDLTAVTPRGWPAATIEVREGGQAPSPAGPAPLCDGHAWCHLEQLAAGQQLVVRVQAAGAEATSAHVRWGAPPVGCDTTPAGVGPWPGGPAADGIVACPGDPVAAAPGTVWQVSGPVIAARGPDRIWSRRGVLAVPVDEGGSWHIAPASWAATRVRAHSGPSPPLAARWTARDGAFDVGTLDAARIRASEQGDGPIPAALRWQVWGEHAALEVRAVRDGPNDDLVAALRDAALAPSASWPPPGVVATALGDGVRFAPASGMGAPFTTLLAPPAWPDSGRVSVRATVVGPAPPCAATDKPEPIWTALEARDAGTWALGPRQPCDGGPRWFVFAVHRDALVDIMVTSEGARATAEAWFLPAAVWPSEGVPDANGLAALNELGEPCMGLPDPDEREGVTHAGPSARLDPLRRATATCWPRGDGEVVVTVDQGDARAWSLAVRIR